MTCEICNHPNRDKIEQAILTRDFGDNTVTLEAIAKEFKVTYRELQIHALMHSPMPEVSEGADSLTARAKVSEAEMLRATALEYYATLKNVGSRVNKIVSAPEGNLNSLNANLVNLYLGAGTNIRSIVDTLIKLNDAVNGGEDTGVTALGALVKVIRGSSEEN